MCFSNFLLVVVPQVQTRRRCTPGWLSFFSSAPVFCSEFLQSKHQNFNAGTFTASGCRRRNLEDPPVIQTITHLPSGRVLQDPKTPWRPVSEREKQFYHQNQSVTVNPSFVSSQSAVPLGSPLSWVWEEEETTEEWRKRKGWRRSSALLHLLI